MPDKNEMERRKQLLNDLRTKTDEEFESRLPMSRDNFKKLFDHLDTELGDKDCDDTNILTRTFLQKINVDNIDDILEWLTDKDGYCDCEILANLEEQFE